MGKIIIKGYVARLSEWEDEDISLFKQKMKNNTYYYEDENGESISILCTLSPLEGKKVKITIEEIGD